MKNSDLLRGHIRDLRSLRPGCADPTCLVCADYRTKDAAADAVLDKLAALEAAAPPKEPS